MQSEVMIQTDHLIKGNYICLLISVLYLTEGEEVDLILFLNIKKKILQSGMVKYDGVGWVSSLSLINAMHLHL